MSSPYKSLSSNYELQIYLIEDLTHTYTQINFFTVSILLLSDSHSIQQCQTRLVNSCNEDTSSCFPLCLGTNYYRPPFPPKAPNSTKPNSNNPVQHHATGETSDSLNPQFHQRSWNQSIAHGAIIPGVVEAIPASWVRRRPWAVEAQVLDPNKKQALKCPSAHQSKGGGKDQVLSDKTQGNPGQWVLHATTRKKEGPKA